MSYIQKNLLNNNERVELQVEKNKIFLIFVWILGILGFWLLLIPTIKAIRYTIEFATTEYVVTDKKVIEKYGWISTHTDEMLLTKIENITINYTFWGKILNYGNICIQGTNRNNIDFTLVKNAEKVKKLISAVQDKSAT